MGRARLSIAAVLAASAALALLSACTHPCGYVDIRATVTPLGEGRVSTAPLEQPLRITRGISERNSLLEIRVEALELTEGPVRRDTFGKPVYVPWRWYAPILKLPIAVTVLPPFFLAFHDPHAHGGGNWTKWNYFRDVIAWFNLCSAVPTGPREVRTEEKRIRSEELVAPIRERRAPIAGRGVSLSLDGRELATAVSDAEGAVKFDLAPFLKPDLAQGTHTLRLVTLSDAGAPAELAWKLDGDVVRQLIENRKLTPEPALPPSH